VVGIVRQILSLLDVNFVFPSSIRYVNCIPFEQPRGYKVLLLADACGLRTPNATPAALQSSRNSMSALPYEAQLLLLSWLEYVNCSGTMPLDSYLHKQALELEQSISELSLKFQRN